MKLERRTEEEVETGKQLLGQIRKDEVKERTEEEEDWKYLYKYQSAKG